MGGLIPNWDKYSDPMNIVNKPLQMGPLWMEAKYTSGMPMQDKIWFTDPPASSFPACIAVKAASLQSAMAAEHYLRRVREAVMLHGHNIAKWEVLLRVAEELSGNSPELLNYEDFKRDAGREEAKKAFEEDLQKVRLHNISRFPTLTINKLDQPGVIIVGYRPYDALVAALKQVAPELEPVQQATDAESYRRFWAGATDREVQEVLGQAHQATIHTSAESKPGTKPA